MAYAAYRYPPGAARDTAGARNPTTVFQVLDITVASTDACAVRRALAGCPGTGVLRCEPLLHAHATCSSGTPHVRLMVRLPLASYGDVLHCLLECVPDGQIGPLTSWKAHLTRCGIVHGG